MASVLITSTSTGMETALVGWLASALVMLGCSSASTPSTPTPSVTVASIALSTSAATLFATTTLQLTATPRDASGKALSGQTITWTSSAPAVATVSPTGLVTTLSGGAATITAATGAVKATAAITSEAVTLVLDSAQQIFHFHQADAFGMSAVPDMHTALLQRADGSYRVWISGRFANDSIEGATGLVTTRDFLTYAPVGSITTAQPVLIPSCRYPFSVSCGNNFDAYYAGADWVYPASNGRDLLMLYHGETRYYSGTNAPAPGNADPGWSVVALARSADSGVTWTGRVPVVSGADAKPATPPATGIYGTVEPGIIAANGYIYAFYANFPLVGVSTIQVARAPLSGDAAPGTWIKYNNGWGAEPGLGGTSSAIVATAGICTRPAQPWPVYSSYINGYLLIFICREGWFVSASTDLVNWTTPVQVFNEPNGEFNTTTDENVILVTRGNAPQVIGQTGYALYANTPNWGNAAHELWLRQFTIRRTP